MLSVSPYLRTPRIHLARVFERERHLALALSVKLRWLLLVRSNDEAEAVFHLSLKIGKSAFVVIMGTQLMNALQCRSTSFKTTK